MANIDKLSELIQQNAAYQGGYLPQGQRPIDKISNIFSGAVSGVNTYEKIIKDVLENKKIGLENQKTQVGLTPVGNYLGVPSNPQDIQNATQQQNTRVPENIYPQQSAELENGGLPSGVQGPPQQAPAQSIPGTAPLNQGLQAFQQKYKMSPTTPVDAVPEVSKLAIMNGEIPMFINKTTNQVSFDPKSVVMGYEPFTNLPSKQAATIAAEQSKATMPQKFISGEQAIKDGIGTKNTTVVTPMQQGLNPYATTKEKIAFTGMMPSQMGQTTVPGSASQVLQRVQKAQTLIANPISSPQRLSLVATDIAGALQQGAPQMDSIKGAGFSDNMVTRVSKLRQELLSKPEGSDVPEIRLELYNIAKDLKDSVLPSIQNQLTLAESMYPNQLPPNWTSTIKPNELGSNTPTPIYNSGQSDLHKSPKPGGTMHQDAQGNRAWVYPNGTFDEVK